MSDLKCKNCGGNIYINDTTNQFICDSCGASQSLNDAFSKEFTDAIFDQSTIPEEKLREYHKALARMERVQSENGLLATAEMFEKIPDILNSEFLAKECRNRSALLKKERLYSTAAEEFESKEPERVKYAISLLETIVGYKDTNARLEEYKRLLPEIEHEYEEHQKEQAKIRLKEHQERERLAKKRKRQRIRLALIAAALIAAIAWFYSAIYSSSNVKISILPNENGYVTTKYSSYVFNYDVNIKNNSFFDISGIHADIYFEEPNGNILIDTNLNIGNYGSTSTTAVRSHKSTEYNWSVSVSSEDIAQKLSEYDFKKLDVKIKIKEISFTNGKKKSY